MTYVAFSGQTRAQVWGTSVLTHYRLPEYLTQTRDSLHDLLDDGRRRLHRLRRPYRRRDRGP